MKTFKWIDEAAGVVAVIDEDGISRQNGKVDALVPLAARGAIMPADPVVPAEPEAVTKRKAILDALGLTEAQLNSLLRLAGTP